MNLAKITDGVITEYPLTGETYQQAVEDGLNFPFAAEKLTELGLVNVIVNPRPVTDAYDYTAQAPQLIEGEWRVTWQKDMTTPEDVIATRTLNVSNSQRANRDILIKEVQWRFERHARLVRLNQPQIDDIAELDIYVQALANVPAQAGFPFNVQWPQLPNR
jgi:hypothetical protein